MAEKPIIFNAEMVRAILKGIKTQTRRAIKPQPETPNAHVVIKDDLLTIYEGVSQRGAYLRKDIRNMALRYGQKGDRLWVRESIVKREIANWISCYGATYAADFTPVMGEGPLGSYCGRAVCDWKWKRNILPSIFMPRWASRITLEIIKVRVEQLQQICYEDIREEGCFAETQDAEIEQFSQLWDSINAKRGFSWQENPWVWVIMFQVLEP